MRGFRLGTFSPSVLVEVATRTGRLAEAGLAVTEVPTTSSPQQFTDLFAGDLDAVLTNPDNVLAYRCVPTNPLGRTEDVRILAAVDRGLGLSLFSKPGVATPALLRGNTIGVDVPGSGFAFVAFELLDRLGLRRGDDYAVEALGATPRRAKALLAGDITGTVLNAGNDLFAEDGGAHRLASVTSIGPYAGAVLAATGEAMRRETPALRGLVKALTRTARDIIDGEHRDLVLDATMRRLGLDGDAAHRHVGILTEPATGLVLGGRLARDELATVVELRNRHASGSTPLSLDAVLDSGLLDDSLLA
ncbi:ABC transporter substrate-binding protein [Amycolatopsis sp. WQ 127309]|uniref:ABC transporter substrate-binding protein n=1 Tax=Amycolatopsis sp. WQ 127309 TaxID=2932773 RepID=UPI001FF5B1A1|nr:hypothetical protein [Amycolatopsis sp. WQ 127309]UOZ03472.1 hypothetical protein MUY22_32040 [Amycolatopsis sp. WQ 127309]